MITSVNAIGRTHPVRGKINRLSHFRTMPPDADGESQRKADGPDAALASSYLWKALCFVEQDEAAPGGEIACIVGILTLCHQRETVTGIAPAEPGSQSGHENRLSLRRTELSMIFTSTTALFAGLLVSWGYVTVTRAQITFVPRLLMTHTESVPSARRRN